MSAVPRRRLPLLTVLLAIAVAPACAEDQEICGSGSWQPGSFEIHHLALGQADSTLIVAPTGHTLLVDAGETGAETTAGAERVGRRVREILGCRVIDQALITHFHADHAGTPGAGGLWHLVHRQGFQVGVTWHRDVWRFGGDGATLAAWRAHLRDPAAERLRPRIAEPGMRLGLGPRVEGRVVVVDGGGGLRPGDFGGSGAAPSENDYSVAVVIRFGRLDYFLGGDLSGEHFVGAGGAYSYHDVETAVAARVGDVDVYRVNHHGSAHSSNPTWLGQLAPRVSIVSVGDNPHGHPHATTMQRLLSRGAVYLTGRGDTRTPMGAARVAGDTTVASADGIAFTVNGDPYQAHDPVRVDRDRDGYFQQVDPDDARAEVAPAPYGGCDPRFQPCR